MSLFPDELESERLRYERIHPDSFDPYELYEHAREGAPYIEEITRWVTWDPHQTPKETFEWVERTGEAFENGENASYVLRPRAGEREGEFAGTAGLGVDWERQLGTLGIWLREPFWGQGYSGERAGRFLQLAFDRLDLEAVMVSHAPENEQSERAISKYVERFGGRREGTMRYAIEMDGEGQDVVRYSITREEFDANR